MTVPTVVVRVPPAPLGPGVRGIARIEAVIDENGNVADACFLDGDPRIGKSQLETVKLWRFTPAVAQGKAIRLTFVLTISVQ